MKKIINNIKYLKIRDLFAPLIFIFVLPISFLFRIINYIKKRDLLLIIEDGTTARDNGYHFYKYIRLNHKEDYCFYVIDKKVNDYNKIKQYGNIIQYRSLKHWIYYMSAKFNISNQKNGNPNATFFYIIHVILGLYNNRIFLQHGITKDDSPWLYYKNTKFNYFICGAKKEYEYIKEKFGYPDGNIVYTGFARFDNLYNNKVNKNQILIMPTWRNWLGRETNSLGKKIEFKETTFYKNWNELLNDKEFVNYIENNNLKVLFYPHINMKKYINTFSINSKNIKVVDSKTDIQKVLKESSLMITDYSSVYMDFAYMHKPVIYYQFDYDEYRKKQLQQGYFDYNNDGFGPVCYTVDELTKEFISIMNNGLKKKYYERMDNFFELKDQNNCERIYDLLNKKEFEGEK
ncbi:MAG: CDP-glycerol glycerophosphotransferase family protein [Bacilli bacterium]|nr:CDP-glycerol glycerophosphotransferase family protein [Bacilli bacterium]